MGLFNRFANLWRRGELDRNLDEELQFHLEARVRDNINAGMTPDAAQRDASRRFGNRTLAKENAREMNLLRWMETFGQDLRFALRGLRKSPAFASVAILALTLGIGANTAVFTVVEGVLLRPLPFPQAGRLMLISYHPQHGPFESGPGLSDTHYLEFHRQTRAFEQVATFAQESVTLTGAGDAIRVPAAMVTASFFPVLRVNPKLGRSFLQEEEQSGRNSVAMLSDQLWRTRFNADPNILGRDITLDGVSRKVIGIMPARFSFPNNVELWVPLQVGGDPHNSYFRPVLGRLRPDVSAQQAQAELSTLTRHLQVRAEDSKDMLAEILPLRDLLVGNIRKSLLIFMGAVGFVLLIACANVANLLLMRATSRQSEIAVRTALGAHRNRLIRQLLTESMLVSLLGAAAGILLAVVGVPVLLALAPPGRIPRAEDVHMDGWVLAFTLVLALGTGLLFGLAPAFRATRRELNEALNQSGRAVAGSRQGLRNALVIAEVAFTLILLAGAGLMLKSFLRMRSVNPGFHPENTLVMTVDLPDSVYKTPTDMQAFDARILAKLASLPEVSGAAAVNFLPFEPFLIRGDFHVEDGRRLPPGYSVDKPAVSPEYFRVMGVRLLNGRSFTARDDAQAPGVAIISHNVAQTLWPGEDPIGRRITLEDQPESRDWLTIIGIVDDVRQQGLTSRPDPAIYQPYQQIRRSFFLSHMTFAVRTAANEEYIAAAMRGIVQQVDRNLPVQSITAMTDVIAASSAEPWFQTRLIAAFSFLALLLSSIGIYGVLSYAVTERTREIGIRMALGAEKSDITQMVVQRSLLLVGAGVGIGVAGALVVTRVLTRFLFEVAPSDPATFVLVAALLAAVGLLAGLLPAGRAARVDPLVALRCE